MSDLIARSRTSENKVQKIQTYFFVKHTVRMRDMSEDKPARYPAPIKREEKKLGKKTKQVEKTVRSSGGE